MVNFLHFTWYETAFWISAEHRVAHKGIILSLLNSAYTELRPLLFLVPPPHEEAERTQLGWLTPTMALCLAYNAWGRRRKEAGDIQSDGISLLKPQLCMMEPGCPGDGCLPMGRDEWLPSFLLLGCIDSYSPIKLSLSQPSCFFFCSSSSLLHPSGRQWARGQIGLSCNLGLNHTYKDFTDKQNRHKKQGIKSFNSSPLKDISYCKILKSL